MGVFMAVGWASGRDAAQRVEADAAESLRQLASRMAFALGADLHERQREVQNLSRIEPLLRADLPADRWRPLLTQLKDTFSHYAWIGLADDQGMVVAATGGVLEGISVAQRDWFIQGMKGPFAGDVHEALLLARKLPPRPDGTPLRLVDVAAPLQREGRPAGVLGAHLDLAWAEARRASVLQMLPRDRGVDLMVFDRGGRLIVGNPDGAQDTADGSGQVARMVLATLSGGPQVVDWPGEGRHLTAAVEVVRDSRYPGLAWIAVARQPEAIALASAHGLQRRIWALGALGALVFGLAAWWLSGWLTAPLRRVLTRTLAATPTLADPPGPAGPPEGRGPDAESHDEIEQLAQAFDGLVGRLQAHQQELLALNASLEQKVAARTLALQRANDDLRIFTHSVSHDLKAPLGSMAAAVKLIQRRTQGSLDAGQDRLLQSLGVECERLYGMTAELLSQALLESQPLRPQRIDMAAMVLSVVDELRAQVHRGAAFGQASTEVDIGTLPDVDADPVLLRQVWTNLLSNAFKFSARTASPRVTVRGATTPGGMVEYSVADNGAGFDPAAAPKLFTLFRRLHPGTDYPGTGVGLSMVQRIVLRHGGSIRADARPGAGACFTFVLPREAAGEETLPATGGT
jgi:signal transduction histidine kinase